MNISEKRRRSQGGLTLIEMLVVVTIIGLFAAIVGVNMFKQADKARVKAAKVQMNSFFTALGTYKLETGSFPTTEQGLQALRERPANLAGWDGPYLRQEIPLDPWNHPYIYKFPGDHGDEPDIICYGADGQPGGTDIAEDIVSWKTK